MHVDLRIFDVITLIYQHGDSKNNSSQLPNTHILNMRHGCKLKSLKHASRKYIKQFLSQIDEHKMKFTSASFSSRLFTRASISCATGCEADGAFSLLAGGLLLACLIIQQQFRL